MLLPFVCEFLPANDARSCILKSLLQAGALRDVTNTAPAELLSGGKKVPKQAGRKRKSDEAENEVRVGLILFGSD